MHRPLRFSPFLRPTVWGGRRLGEVLNKPLDTTLLYGESWEVSDHAVHRSVAASDPWAGRSLRDLMEHERADLLGVRSDAYGTFPWLIKFLDAHDWLSVQVHPDEAAVRRLLPKEGSKTEAWFVIDAARGSRVYAGLLPGVDERSLRQALAEGAVAECLHSFEPRPGDCVFLPAGTVHAVGGGVLMAEIQQTSDATFRLFDWNRLDAQGKSRPLHFDQALSSIHWDQGPVNPVKAQGFAASLASGSGTRRQALVCSPYFTLEYLQASKSLSLGGAERLQALVILEGAGDFAGADWRDSWTKGQAWILPAAMPSIRCSAQGEIKALLCTLP